MRTAASQLPTAPSPVPPAVPAAGPALTPSASPLTPSAPPAPPNPHRPAEIAAGRALGLSVMLGVLGLTSAVFVIARLLESWRVTSGPASHAISLFGQRVSYPAANTGAIAVTALAALGLLMVGAA